MVSVAVSRMRIVDSGKIRAYVNISIDGVFKVVGLKVIETEDGRLWVAMPSYRTKDGKYKNIFYIAEKEARDKIIDLIIQEYQERSALKDDETVDFEF